MRKAALANAVTVRFFMPSPALAPYVTTYYLTEVDLPAGEAIEDWLHPEWANLRFASTADWQGAIGDAPLRVMPRFAASGPTCHATRFRNTAMRSWGIGLLPLGWARLVDVPAADHADRTCDGQVDPAFEQFAPLLALLFDNAPDPVAEAATIDAHLLGQLAARPVPDDEAKVHAAHTALLDPDIGTVAALADRLNISPRSLERLSLRAFGFPPKLLLRRQRFLRSLAQFMLDPSLSWIRTLDWLYVDQAHFVRDFKSFMGMSPTRYASLEHPVLRAAAQARAAATGEAVQALHRP